MNKADIREFKKFVVACLITKYNMNEVTATKAVKNSYLSKALNLDPDYVMHDTVEEWADYVYGEVNQKELLQM